MAKTQWYALAVAAWLLALVCGIAYAGLSDDGRSPTPLLILGGIVCVALGVLAFRQPKRMDARRAMRQHPMDAIVDAIAASRVSMIVLASFMAAFVLGVLVLVVTQGVAASADGMTPLVIGAMCLAIAVFAARRAQAFKDPRNNELMDVILQRPRELAWIYTTSMVINRATYHYLHVWTSAKKHYNLRIDPEDIDVVMGELGVRAPHAMKPYSRDAQRAFKRDPTGFSAVPEPGR